MANGTVTLTSENFDELAIGASKPILVDFWASWCGPCLKVGPILDEIAAEREDIIVGKVNVDNHPDLASKYSVQSIPTIILLVDGKTTPIRFIGAKTKEQMLDDISPYIKQEN